MIEIVNRSTSILCAFATTLACQRPNALEHPASDTRGAPEERAPVRVALTFDDLPAHGPLLPGQSIVQVHQSIVQSLKQHHVPSTYGFMNGAKLALNPDEGRQVLDLWLSAGHPLGNHTWSHANVNVMSVAEFAGDIQTNDALLSELVGDAESARKQRRMFRYPYLRQGLDLATIEAVRGYLQENAYRIAEVTIDFWDWAYNGPYARCVARADEKAVAGLRQEFLERAAQSLEWSKAAALAIYGAPIPHVLVLHTGSFDALVLDDLLSHYEQAGVQWIPLEEALSHAAYQEDVSVPAANGVSLLERRIQRDRGSHSAYPIPLTPPTKLLDQLCR